MHLVLNYKRLTVLSTWTETSPDMRDKSLKLISDMRVSFNVKFSKILGLSDFNLPSCVVTIGLELTNKRFIFSPPGVTVLSRKS